MKQLILCIAFLGMTMAGNAQQSSSPVLPLPERIEYKEGTYTVPQKISIYEEGAVKTARYAVAELKKQFGITAKIVKSKETADWIVRNTALEPESEHYQLLVTSSGVTINSSSEKGAFYGIQSLFQLMNAASSTNHSPIKLVEQAITDSPRFSWRSLLLDEARFFKGEKEVKRLLDVMAQLKMNVFHWHLTDDQGWRIEIKKYPKLTEVGSKRKDSQSGGFQSETYIGQPHEGYYTQAQIKDIVSYARERHIKVVPEIEMPGHASAAIAAYPWLGSSSERIEVPIRFGKLHPVYNVTDAKVRTFLQDVVGEVIDLFQTDVIHIGGDEVRFNQWEANSEIVAYKKAKGFASFMDIQIEFTNHMSRYIQEQGCSMMGWNEILGKNLHADDHISFEDPNQKVASNVIVQFWKGNLDEMKDAARNGYKLVNSYHAYTYLDYTYEAIPLEKTYHFNPIPEGLPKEYEKNIIGMGAQMWGEFIPTVDRMNEQLYPRVAALAEVAWSKKKEGFEDFLVRLQHVEKYWLTLGIHLTKN